MALEVREGAYVLLGCWLSSRLCRPTGCGEGAITTRGGHGILPHPLMQ